MSVGFPQKAFNVRRDGRVALLFSEPHGSGLDRAEQVLVLATATCPDEIVTTPGDLAQYWSTLFQRQPSSQAYLNPLLRPVVDWYYMRLVITITPTQVINPASTALRTLGRTRRSTQEYLRNRGLPRPRIDWAGSTAAASTAKHSQ